MIFVNKPSKEVTADSPTGCKSCLRKLVSGDTVYYCDAQKVYLEQEVFGKILTEKEFIDKVRKNG